MLTGTLVQRQDHEKMRCCPTTPAPGGFTLRDLAPAATLLTVGLIGLLAASLSGPGRSGQYLIVAAPWASLGQTINLIGSADGRLVEPGRFPNIAIAASSQADFAERARFAGAWLVFPSPRIAGCFSAPTEVSPQ